jgi:hypothetical protein
MIINNPIPPYFTARDTFSTAPCDEAEELYQKAALMEA